MLITLLIFLALLSLLVFVHELGHFLVAKRTGVKVLEFAFGFKPRIWGKKIGETTYAINAIPLGGYVHMYGEDEKKEGNRAFNNKSPKQRLGILVAGATMNFILGWVVLIVLMITGFEPFFPGVANNPFINSTQSVKIVAVSSGSPAEQAGFKVGDRLIKVDGQPVATDSDFLSLVSARKGQSIEIIIENNGQRALTATPRINPPAGQGSLGVAIAAEGKVKSSVIAAPAAALYETGRVIGLSAAGFGNFVKNLVIHQKVGDEVTGLIGVGQVTGIARQLGIDYLFQLLAVISIGLGVVNLLPIIPLDGGHMAVIIFEGVTKKRLNDKQLNILATAGLTIVVLLFIIVTAKDFVRFDILGRFF